MGKRHSIVARKTSGDAKKSQIYAKIGKTIQMASKFGIDPDMNPKLELALQKARYYSLPKDVIERAIKKGSGQLDGCFLEEYVYEGYGPGGSAIIIKASTDNNNRTSANIKTIFGKNFGDLGKQGSVLWLFSEKGFFFVNGKIEKKLEKGNLIQKIVGLDDEFEMNVLDLPILDIIKNEEGYFIYCTKDNYNTVQDGLYNISCNFVESEIKFFPNNYIDLSIEETNILNILIDSLKEDEDVDDVYCNVLF